MATFHDKKSTTNETILHLDFDIELIISPKIALPSMNGTKTLEVYFQPNQTMRCVTTICFISVVE